MHNLQHVPRYWGCWTLCIHVVHNGKHVWKTRTC
jgi:hypothetical protein